MALRRTRAEVGSVTRPTNLPIVECRWQRAGRRRVLLVLRVLVPQRGHADVGLGPVLDESPSAVHSDPHRADQSSSK
jgi:hypothetical protein